MELPSTINGVLERLDAIIDESVERKSPNAFFAYLYRRTTAEIKHNIDKGVFEDNPRMEAFDVYFANLYIRAYQDYCQKQPVSAAWKAAFDTTGHTLCISQHIVLGMNAHINLDLAIAAAHVSEGKQIAVLQTDFNRVNAILFSLTQEMQRKLGKVSRMLYLADWAGKNTDERLIDFSIGKARSASWISANAIWKAQTTTRSEVIRNLDTQVAVLGNSFKRPKSYVFRQMLKLIIRYEEKDVAKIIRVMQEG